MRRPDVGLGKVIALEQEGCALADRQRVGEAVSEVEAGRMPPLAEAAIGVGGGIGEVCVERDGRDLLHGEKFLGALDADIAEVALHHHQELGTIGCTQTNGRCGL